ncbi:hypothetical protein [Archaeoglobus sp.]
MRLNFIDSEMVIDAVNSSRTISEAASRLNISEIELFQLLGELYAEGKIKDVSFVIPGEKQ